MGARMQQPHSSASAAEKPRSSSAGLGRDTHRAARQSTVPRLRPRWSHRCVSVPTDSQRHVQVWQRASFFFLSRCQERGQRRSDQRYVEARVPLPPAPAGGDGEGQSQGTAPGPLPASHGLWLWLVLHQGRVFVFDSPTGSSSKNLANHLLNRYDFWDPFGQRVLRLNYTLCEICSFCICHLVISFGASLFALSSNTRAIDPYSLSPCHCMSLYISLLLFPPVCQFFARQKE